MHAAQKLLPEAFAARATRADPWAQGGCAGTLGSGAPCSWSTPPSSGLGTRGSAQDRWKTTCFLR